MKKKKLEAKLSETRKKLVRTKAKLKELKAKLGTKETENAVIGPDTAVQSPADETPVAKRTTRPRSKAS